MIRVRGLRGLPSRSTVWEDPVREDGAGHRGSTPSREPPPSPHGVSAEAGSGPGSSTLFRARRARPAPADGVAVPDGRDAGAPRPPGDRIPALAAVLWRRAEQRRTSPERRLLVAGTMGRWCPLEGYKAWSCRAGSRGGSASAESWRDFDTSLPFVFAGSRWPPAAGCRWSRADQRVGARVQDGDHGRRQRTRMAPSSAGIIRSPFERERHDRRLTRVPTTSPLRVRRIPHRSITLHLRTRPSPTRSRESVRSCAEDAVRAAHLIR